MDKQEKNSMLIEEIKEKLDWYISEASDEEYDEKAVESLQYLLDTLEPMEEGMMPDVDEAWERFWALAEEKDKKGELFGAVEGIEAVGLGNTGVNDADVDNADVDNANADNANGDDAKCSNASKGNVGGQKLNQKLLSFVAHHRSIVAVAAVFLVLVLAVSVGVQTEAVKNSGFFHWLKYDETGMQMVTSPDSLDGMTEIVEKNVYYDREEVPKWAKEWMITEQETMEGEGYEWQHIEVKENQNVSIVVGYYLKDEDLLSIGVTSYLNSFYLNTESYDAYTFVENISDDKMQMDVFKKEENSGKIYYKIIFWGEQCQYYVQIEDDLQEVKRIAKRYWEKVFWQENM